jgi:glyoxylate reductase
MARIFVTRKVPFWDEISKPLLDSGHEVVVSSNNRVLTREELANEVAKGYDGMMTLLTDTVDKQLLEHDANKQLKVIANYAVGFDNINVGVCAERGIKVSNTPSDKVNESVAEHAWTLMLTLSRRIIEAHDFVRNAAYRGWDPDIFIGRDLVGKTVGIVGMGRIGEMVARRERGFGMKVIYFNRSRLAEEKEKELGLQYAEKLDDLISESDYVTLHVPLTSETKHLINGKNLPLFKKTAYLVNTARGPVVDEGEIVEALRAGILAGYGTDVFENEPNPHPELLQMENVVMTPHIASATEAARKDMGQIAVKNLIAGFNGDNLPNQVGK